ncbi:hypothetical protein CspeluHIS016_0101690 [Cutaneotrichosporon spelunceum]|uniref:Uncharacterized protein n=1 Tax=Cutaneotrichosporon spelunceum TaxID=1672016 RepID=A0AAD3TN06_9TREE|nr:hypothetical protein CspeluHIS016_0101690 [Cutaneotrichosporon spelunceum]
METSLAVDDFDPLVVYSNYDDWSTPNPQDNPTWWDADRNVTNSVWHQATYHYTEVAGAQASFNFTGSSVDVYGATGPTGGNYTVTLDGNATTHQTANGTDRTLLYSARVADGGHQLSIVNHGSGLLLDLFTVEFIVGGEGATLSNKTLDDRDPNIVYRGSWTQQTGPNFYSGTSTYTSGPGNSMSLNFSGSAVYVYGDQVNDHGVYTVTLNGSVVGQYNGRSGCGGGYAKAYLDYIEYTVPSVYALATESNACSGANCSTSAMPSPTGKGSGATTAAPVALLCGVLGAWCAKMLLH